MIDMSSPTIVVLSIGDRSYFSLSLQSCQMLKREVECYNVFLMTINLRKCVLVFVTTAGQRN